MVSLYTGNINRTIKYKSSLVRLSVHTQPTIVGLALFREARNNMAPRFVVPVLCALAVSVVGVEVKSVDIKNYQGMPS